jgi:predicted metal-dependent phosphoesterase TrpH
MQESRRDRNRRMILRLNELGIDITMQEVEAVGGPVTGRPHFAQILLRKGYVASRQQAFDEYLDESAQGYVYREEPSLVEAIRRILDGGGLPVLAHPTRFPFALEEDLPELAKAGLGGIEVWHSDHSACLTDRFSNLAAQHALAVTGGSDFHGDAKPSVKLGTGVNGNLSVPKSVLDRLRGL